MKNKTIEFLESSNETARITKLEAELELVKARNEILEEDSKLIAKGQAASRASTTACQTRNCASMSAR